MRASAVALILASLSSAQCQVQGSLSELRGPCQSRYATQLGLLSDLGLDGMYAGFVLGSSLGVYAGGDGQARRISAPATVLSGVIGAGIGICVYMVSEKKGAFNLAPLLLPLVTSIIYVEVLGAPAS